MKFTIIAFAAAAFVAVTNADTNTNAVTNAVTNADANAITNAATNAGTNANAMTNAATNAGTNVNTCDVLKLQTLLVSGDTTKCADDSEYTVTMMASPSKQQLDSMCKSTACHSVLLQIKKLAPNECMLANFSLYGNLISPLEAHCKEMGSSGAKGTVPVPSGKTTLDTTQSDKTTSKSPSTPHTDVPSSSKEPTTSTQGNDGASIAAVSTGAFVVALAATFF